MLYYRLFSGEGLFIRDVMTFFIIGIVAAIVSFFLILDYFKVRRKKFFGPTGKLVAGIIVGVIGLLHLACSLLALSY